MDIIFSLMILASLVFAFFNGTAEQTVMAGLDGAKASVETVLSFAGIMCMWSGFIKVADKGGAIKALERIISPFMRFLFPKLKKGEKALSYISANISANLLGVGNAATPAGICAMEELDNLNENPERASDEMCIFAVINSASIQLIPTTVIALRSGFGSENPQGIIVPIWISSAAALVCAVTAMKILLMIRKKALKNGNKTSFEKQKGCPFLTTR